MRGLCAPGLMDKDVSDAILAILLRCRFELWILHPSDNPIFTSSER